jgi:hypothetical protein
MKLDGMFVDGILVLTTVTWWPISSNNFCKMKEKTSIRYSRSQSACVRVCVCLSIHLLIYTHTVYVQRMRRTTERHHPCFQCRQPETLEQNIADLSRRDPFPNGSTALFHISAQRCSIYIHIYNAQRCSIFLFEDFGPICIIQIYPWSSYVQGVPWNQWTKCDCGKVDWDQICFRHIKWCFLHKKRSYSTSVCRGEGGNLGQRQPSMRINSKVSHDEKFWSRGCGRVRQGQRQKSQEDLGWCWQYLTVPATSASV